MSSELMFYLGAILLVPALWGFLRSIFITFMYDPGRHWLFDQEWFRQTVGGHWYNVLPSFENFVLNDRCGWRRSPPKKGDLLTEERHYTNDGVEVTYH